MPLNNNNKKVPSVVGRVSKLPVVRSACSGLSHLYTETKRRNPSLKSFCDVLESRVSVFSTAAFTTASPFIEKLEPQISIANVVACKSLDWLEASFPVLLSPTEQVVSAVMTKINKLQDRVSTAASGTIECVQHTVTWAISGRPRTGDGASSSLLGKAISMATVGLDSALTLSEALVDHVLPPAEEDAVKETRLEGFTVTTRRGSYSVRIVKLTIKLCQRTYQAVGSKIPSVQVRRGLSRSTVLVQDLQSSCWTLVWSIQVLPQYIHHQAASMFVFITQMYNLSCPTSGPERSRGRNRLMAAEAPRSNRDLVLTQNAPAFRVRPTRMAVLENGCNMKGNAH